MTDADVYIAVASRLSPEERDRLLASVLILNPRLKGANVDDVLSIADDADGYLEHIEPFLEEHGNRLVAAHGSSGRELRAAAIAAAILVPEEMTPLVERLLTKGKP